MDSGVKFERKNSLWTTKIEVDLVILEKEFLLKRRNWQSRCITWTKTRTFERMVIGLV